MLEDVKSDNHEDTEMSYNLPFQETYDEYSDNDDSISSPSDMKTNNDASEFVFDQEHSWQVLAKLVFAGKFPIDVVEHTYFLKFARSIQPQFEMGSMETLKEDCLAIYVIEKAKLKEMLRNVRGRISLSLDIWRSEDTSEFICLLGHFVDNGWKLRKRVLYFRRAPDPLFEVDLSEAIFECLMDWDIDEKMYTFTLNNSSTNDALAAILEAHFRGKTELLLSGRLFRVHCCTNILNLMVKDVLNSIHEIINKVHEIMFYKPSDIPLFNRPWNATYLMLKRALECRESFSPSDMEYMDMPSAGEWKKVECICALLKIVHNVANVFSKTKCPTTSIYFHNLWEFQTHLTQESMSSDCFISTLAKEMLQKFVKYWEDMFLVLAVATVMDPRCKIKYIEFFSLKYGGSKANSYVTLVNEAIHKLYNEYATLSSCESEQESVRTDETGSCSDIGWLQDYHEFLSTTRLPQKSELDWYLDLPVAPWSQDFDVLSWWKAETSKYPTLSRMARDILAIPISVVTKESAYYIEGTELDPRLSSLDDDIMEALICGKSWMRSIK